MPISRILAIPLHISKDELKRLFSVGVPDEIAHALVSAAFHETDWRWVQGWFLQFTDHADSNVRRVAITALGHLARIHHALDLERVLPVLVAKSNETELLGTVEDTLSDIQLFIPGR